MAAPTTTLPHSAFLSEAPR